MRHIWGFLLLVAIGASHGIDAWGQACYTPVKSWQGNYTLSTNASGVVCPAGGGDGVCNISESSAVTVNMSTPVASCSQLQFFGPDSPTTLSLNSSGTFPCDPTGSQTITAQSTSGGSSFSVLTLNLSNSTYIYSPAPIANITISDSGCGGGVTTSNTSAGLFPPPAGVWPLTFSLPPNVAPLVTGLSFPGQDSVFLADVSWEFSFTLNPSYTDDDDCKRKARSEVGCQNQSLGEDVPLVGTGFHLHYEGDRAPGAGGSGIAVAQAAMLGGWTLSVHHAFDPGSNTLFLGDGRQRNGSQMGTPVTSNGNLLVTSEDGSEVYVFDLTSGHHLQTLKSLTGALKYQFAYDPAGDLVSVTDASGNITSIQRNASEQPTAIVSPYAQTTTLSIDANGFLSQVSDPAGNTETFTNYAAGLISSRTDANGNVSNYTYDGQGRLTEDADSIGGFVDFGRSVADSGFGYTVGETTSMGRTTTYQTTLNLPWAQNGSAPESEQHTNTWPNGLQASETRSLQNGQFSIDTSLPDGSSGNETRGPDPRFGLQWPVILNQTLSQGDLTMSITGSRTARFTAGNPFSLTKQTEARTVNGREYTSLFTTATKTWLEMSPMKRRTTTVLDSLERPISLRIGTLLPLEFAYDANGRLATIAQGTRISTFTYDANGFVATSTDPLNQTTGFTHDAAGRLSSETFPDGRQVTYTYDGNGNLTSVTPPGRTAHVFAYDAVDDLLSYKPPTLSGTGATVYAYNTDRDLTTITRPDGQIVQFGYDSAGRVNSATTPSEAITYSYDANTGNLSSASVTGGESLTFGYDGPLLTASALGGSVAGSVSRTYNDNFWVSSESIGGGNTISFTYDNDGLVTNAGALGLKSNSDGMLTETSLGAATDSFVYDTFGELTSHIVKYGTAILFSDRFTRDSDGRISGKTEIIGKKRNTFTYTYDLAGRLTGVNENGVTVSSYTYDSNSNRLTAATSAGTVNGTYDAQDRLLTYGTASYTYTANGELASQTVGSQTITYSYDPFGNLTAASLPNGTAISYIVDANNHRVGKQVNGTLIAGYLYDGDRIVAQVSSSGSVTSQFVYASGSASPDYMIQGGVAYRIFSDQLGSPRLVVNTATGATVEEIDYDEFGNVVNDTNPGFQPYGFAGGLYDPDLKLVRFGARDYNPAVGRWTSKDPTLFSGGDANFYDYGANDPVNRTDPAGLTIFRVNASDFVSGSGAPGSANIKNAALYRVDATKWVKPTCRKCKQKRPVMVMPPIQIRPPIRMAPIQITPSSAASLEISFGEIHVTYPGYVEMTLGEPRIVRQVLPGAQCPSE